MNQALESIKRAKRIKRETSSAMEKMGLSNLKYISTIEGALKISGEQVIFINEARLLKYLKNEEQKKFAEIFERYLSFQKVVSTWVEKESPNVCFRYYGIVQSWFFDYWEITIDFRKELSRTKIEQIMKVMKEGGFEEQLEKIKFKNLFERKSQQEMIQQVILEMQKEIQGEMRSLTDFVCGKIDVIKNQAKENWEKEVHNEKLL